MAITAAIVLSSSTLTAPGKITAIDDKPTKSVPGVIEVFTHENTGDVKTVEYEIQEITIVLE